MTKHWYIVYNFIAGSVLRPEHRHLTMGSVVVSLDDPEFMIGSVTLGLRGLLKIHNLVIVDWKEISDNQRAEYNACVNGDSSKPEEPSEPTPEKSKLVLA